MIDFSQRVDEPELMDTVALPPKELEDALSFLAAVNRHAGGHRVVLGLLDEWTRAWPVGREISVLDVGAGGGDHLLALADWARSRGLRLRAVGIDADEEVARIASRRLTVHGGLSVLHESLGRHAESGARYDFVCASLVLHHIPDAEIVPALKMLDSLAVRGLIINDLRRCLAGYWATRLLTSLAGNRVVKHDGPVSVRRAFTAAELDDRAREAGLLYLRSRRHAGFRLSLAGLKDHG